MSDAAMTKYFETKIGQVFWLSVVVPHRRRGNNAGRVRSGVRTRSFGLEVVWIEHGEVCFLMRFLDREGKETVNRGLLGSIVVEMDRVKVEKTYKAACLKADPKFFQGLPLVDGKEIQWRT